MTRYLIGTAAVLLLSASPVLAADTMKPSSQPIPHSIVVNNKTKAKNRVNSRRISRFLSPQAPATSWGFFSAVIELAVSVFPPHEPNCIFGNTCAQGRWFDSKAAT